MAERILLQGDIEKHLDVIEEEDVARNSREDLGENGGEPQNSLPCREPHEVPGQLQV